MVARSRSRIVEQFGPGTWARKIGTNPVVTGVYPQEGVAHAKYWERTDDVIGQPGVDHPLTITQRDNRGFVPLDGFHDQGGGSYVELRNYLPDLWVNIAHLSTSVPSVGARALALRARTNPSREDVSVPNFIHELRDLPGMIKDIGKIKTHLKSYGSIKGGLKTTANANLAIQMGWLPLVSDIRKMLQFQSLVDKRIVELNKLYSSRGLKRRLRLYSEVQSSTSRNVAIDSSTGTFFRVNNFVVTRVESWGTIRWRPTVVPRDLRRQDLGQKARRLVLGLDHNGFDAYQIWNAIPWTWLADWFTNVDDYLLAHRNDVPAVPTGPCNIMTRTETYVTWQRSDSIKAIKGGEGLRILRTKQRAQSSGSLSVSLPFISGRQFSILQSLAVQRLKR